MCAHYLLITACVLHECAVTHRPLPQRTNRPPCPHTRLPNHPPNHPPPTPASFIPLPAPPRPPPPPTHLLHARAHGAVHHAQQRQHLTPRVQVGQPRAPPSVLGLRRGRGAARRGVGVDRGAWARAAPCGRTCAPRSPLCQGSHAPTPHHTHTHTHTSTHAHTPCAYTIYTHAHAHAHTPTCRKRRCMTAVLQSR